MRHSTYIFACLLLSAAGLNAGLAQSISIGSDPTCVGCRLLLERVVTIGDDDGPGVLYQQSTLSRDSRNRYYISSNYDPVIKVFDARGRYLTSVGRKGLGPGEFRLRPWIYFLPGDSLVTLDPYTMRATVFSPQYKLARTIPLPISAREILPLADGRFVVTGETRSRDLVGLPLHLVSPKGAVIRSFGSKTEVADLTSPVAGQRTIARAAGGRIWSARIDAYKLELLDTTGRSLLELERRADWFPPGVIQRRVARVERPAPRIGAIHEDRSRRLWVVSRVADRNWKPYPPYMRNGIALTPDAIREKLYDSVIEIVDPQKSSLIASQTFPQEFMGFVGDGLLASYEEDADGNPRYAVWRISLAGPP